MRVLCCAVLWVEACGSLIISHIQSSHITLTQLLTVHTLTQDLIAWGSSPLSTSQDSCKLSTSHMCLWESLQTANPCALWQACRCWRQSLPSHTVI